MNTEPSKLPLEPLNSVHTVLLYCTLRHKTSPQLGRSLVSSLVCPIHGVLLVDGGLLAARLLARERPRLRRELLRRERGQPATRGREAPH